MSVALDLLFLPAAKDDTQGFYWSPSPRGEYISRVFFQNRQWYASSAGGRIERDAVRLASRSELSVVMVVVFGLLFLPAAGLRSEKVRFDWGLRYTSILGHSSTQCAVMHMQAPGAPGFIAVGRASGYAVRLASRSELSVVMVVVFGLLFLPAQDGKYVSVWTRTAEAVKASVGMRAAKVTVSVASGVYLEALARQTRLLVRLASRSELFGCSVDGAGLLFLPVVPAAEPVCYWSVSSRADAREYICEAVRIQGGYSSWAYGQYRPSRFTIRLASRQDCFVVMMVLFGLLFLPVAGYRIGLSYDASQGRYWSSVTASNNGESMRAPAAYFTKAQFNTGAIFPRHSLLAIRLASRSELFGYSVDGFGLLFLPAAGSWGYLWTLSSRDRADFAGCAWARRWGNSAQEEIGWWPRSSVASIRLASRQVCLL